MAITRANTESILVKRAGPLMVLAGLDGSTVDGTNADLNDPIGWAVRVLGYVTTDVTAVADADVASVTADEFNDFFDLGELRVLETVIGNYDDVDLRVGPRDEKYHQTVLQAERKVARLKKRLEEAGVFGAATVTAGSMTLDFVEHDDDTS